MSSTQTPTITDTADTIDAIWINRHDEFRFGMVPLRVVRETLNTHDQPTSQDEFIAALHHLIHTRRAQVCVSTYPDTLTPEDRDYRIRIGGEDKNVITCR